MKAPPSGGQVPMRSNRRLLISLNHLAFNFQELKKICPDNQVLFMVKADAYGHGAVPMVNFCFEELGIGEFGCASFSEAMLLRKSLPGRNFTTYIFSDFDLSDETQRDGIVSQNIIPVIFNWRDLDIYLQEKQFGKTPLCLKFNTGMNRLGFSHSEAEKVADRLLKEGRKSVQHLMTHLACADRSVQTHPGSQQQLKRFKEIKAIFRAKGVAIDSSSCANSGLIEQREGIREDSHVRPGLMLYGPSALAEKTTLKHSRWQGKNISQLEALIIKVQSVEVGSTIGYGEYKLSRAGELAIISLGYGDGFTNSFQGIKFGRDQAIGEVVGQVNMDMVYLLFPPGTALQEGESFVLWDHHPQSIYKLSRETGIIIYQLFCQLTARISRQYQLK